MAKYHVYGKVVGGKYIGTVEAESEDEAMQKGWAHDECCACMCHRCAHECEDATIEDIEVERVEEEEEGR